MLQQTDCRLTRMQNVALRTKVLTCTRDTNPFLKVLVLFWHNNIGLKKQPFILLLNDFVY